MVTEIGRLTKAVPTVLLMLMVIFGVGISSTELYAAGNGETAIEQRKPTIGIIHITFETTYFYTSVQYQSFDLSYRKQWERLADQNDFNLIQVEGGTAASTTKTAVLRLLDLGVDAILLFQHDPTVVAPAVELSQNGGIPIAVHGIRAPEEIPAPYIGFAEYETCYRLGNEFARLFRDKNPGKQAKGIILNSRTVISDIEREKGFTDGFKSVLTDAVFFNELEDTGTPDSVRAVVQDQLLRNEGINFIYGTSDLRAQSALSTVQMLAGERTESIIIAGVGGSETALQAILDPESPWKAEVGLNIKGVADKSYEVLRKMMNQEIPLQSTEEYLVDSTVLVNPSRAEVEKYIEQSSMGRK